MKNVYKVAMLALALAFSIGACKKDNLNPDNPGHSNLKPVLTQKGTPISGGIHVVQSIGPGGGIIQSANGEISVTIPEGALPSTQSIGIQEITNTAPLGVGKSFWLTPEGTTFAKPVQITMTYGNIPELCAWIVTQKSDGTWLGDTRANVDAAAGTVTVEAFHFSDWACGKIIDLKMAPENSTLGIKQKRQIVITGFVNTVPDEDEELVPLIPIHQKYDDGLTPIPKIEHLLQLDRYSDLRVARWSLDGVTAPTSGNKGSLEAQNFSAMFTAPDKVPHPNMVQVAATIEAKRKNGGSTTAIFFPT